MKTAHAFRRGAGFSLVELMVSILIGLLAVMFATRIMTDSERNKGGALGGSDSMQNGMMAMFSISADAEQAGFGLNDPLLLGCSMIFEDRGGFALAPAQRNGAAIKPLAAAVIVPGGDGPDSVSLYAGSSQTGTGTMRLISNYNGSSQFSVDRKPYGFAVGDVIVVAPDDGVGDCALAQVSGLAPAGAQPTVSIADTTARFNQGALGRNFTGGASRVFNLGPASSLALHTWSVQNGMLRLQATNLGTDGAEAQAVAANIVSLKAQYGFDTRAGGAFAPELGMQIGAWSSEMIDADGDGVTGGPGDYQRVAALRLAVVARSGTPERAPAGAECTATVEPLKVFESAQPSGVDAVPIELDLSVESDATNWRCYRYRAFETIVPLRNAGWRPTA